VLKFRVGAGAGHGRLRSPHPCQPCLQPYLSRGLAALYARPSSPAPAPPFLQVRGVDALKDFGANLLTPYKPPPSAPGSGGVREAALEAEVAALKKRVAELEGQLAAAKR
jgi:hypothetical protein